MVPGRESYAYGWRPCSWCTTQNLHWFTRFRSPKLTRSCKVSERQTHCRNCIFVLLWNKKQPSSRALCFRYYEGNKQERSLKALVEEQGWFHLKTMESPSCNCPAEPVCPKNVTCHLFNVGMNGGRLSGFNCETPCGERKQSGKAVILGRKSPSEEFENCFLSPKVTTPFLKIVLLCRFALIRCSSGMIV